MSADANERARAANPKTPLADLAALAYEHPELRAVVAANPSTYDDLLAWLRDLDEPEVDRALSARSSAPVAAAAAVADSTELSRVPSTPVAATTTEPMPVVVAWRKIPRLVKLVSASGIAVVVIVAIVAGSLTAAAQQRLEQAVTDHDELQAEADAGAAAAAEPTVAPAPVASSAAWNFANAAGYSFREDITVGTPVRFDADNPPQHQFTSDTIAGTACSLANTDLVIPIKWLTSATTKTFDTSIEMDMVVSPAQSTDYSVMVEQFFSDGTQCKADNDLSRVAVRFTNPLGPGVGGWQPLFVVIKDYFSPNRPDGDPGILSQITLRPISSMYDNSQSGDWVFLDQALIGSDKESLALTLAGATVP
ncbi:MAG: hypothetical protein JWP19_679 [Rhodoglobus sp.]|nr:hypothetical protein [Rhodoglobus sp.]